MECLSSGALQPDCLCLNLAPLITRSVTLGKLSNFFVPQFPSLLHGINNSKGGFED